MPCVPGQTTCLDNDVVECGENCEPGGLVEECDATEGEICSEGSCANACDVADDTPSNIGCEFWAVDLPNERGDISSAADDPWGVVIANAGQTPADVIIERNLADLGQGENLLLVEQVSVPPGLLRAIELPRASARSTA